MAPGPSRGSPLFRAEALDRYLRGEPEGGVLDVVPPRLWALFWLLAAALAAGVLFCLVVRAETTIGGPGVVGRADGRQVLAFLPQVLPPGTPVRIQVAVWPGHRPIRGRIAFMKPELSSPDQIRQMLGDQRLPVVANHAAEISISDQGGDGLPGPLRAGMAVRVRASVGSKRLLEMVLDPRAPPRDR